MIELIVTAWVSYLSTVQNWQDLVQSITPRKTGCGLVYELANPIDRPHESFSIVDMQGIRISSPHYHIHGETEIYIVLNGSGVVVVGGKEHKVQKNSVVITPPNIAHFIIPAHDLVLAVINTPPFKPANSVDLIETNTNVGFNQEQFVLLKSFVEAATPQKYLDELKT